ncbi:MAG TPA: DegV family protein [Candidatus Limivivens intestinipullorum]|uniref:DegV family protein n=1 Tax=Candidatus Limivivens intestinipullorum TaxID=2840858 RepID=A0A9D1JLM5_9FIRM|nr:DegV family protein [Candidatus Limivivens intestinipullorum]
MSYKIIIDSCGELSDEMKKSGVYVSVPLTLMVEGESIVDDESFDQASFLKKVAESPNCPKSSCPSPERYREAFDCGADRVYAVTLSANLSGSYNSAVLGQNIYLEERPDAKVYVFNSRSASVGETLIGLKIQECEEKGMAFEEVVDTVERYIAGQNTWFVLENLDTLRKNGRLSKVKALVATALRIKPVMASTPEGEITQLDQARGMNKALIKMVDAIVEKTEHPEKKTLAISHCNCPGRAKIVYDALMERLPFRDAVVLDTAGVSTMYANDGGIIVVV